MIKRKLFSLFNKARKSKRRELFLLIFCVIAIIVFANPKAFSLDSYSLDAINQKTISGKVVKVTDGDTITVLDKDYAEHKIRFYGIDAPESRQAYGQKAKKFLASLIAGKEVKVVITGIDRYQRKIGKVFLGETDINEEMVANGYAHAYVEYSNEYAPQELKAKEAKLGLWQDKNVVKPSEFRKENKK